MTQNQQKRVKIEYIRKDIPSFEMPAYQGERYEVLAPDTLDLQERATLSVNGLTGSSDENADYELYWVVNFRHNPPMMYHDYNDHVEIKFREALPLMRLASGSDQNSHIERRWMEVILHMQGPDGLLYYPLIGRPWARNGVPIEQFGPLPEGDHYTEPYVNGRLLGAIGIYYLITGDSLWKEVGKKIVDGLARQTVDKGDYAYFSTGQFGVNKVSDPNAPMPGPWMNMPFGWIAMGLAQFGRVTGYEPAVTLAGKLSRYIRYYGKQFDAECKFLPEAPGSLSAHFHGHLYPLLGMLEYAMAAGDEEMIQFVRKGYEYGLANMDTLVGYVPEVIYPEPFQTSEICGVADMIALALKLTRAGAEDYWDDVDRWTRNQFAEGQLIRIDWIYRMIEGTPVSAIDEISQSVEKVPERNIGNFAGWPSANDWLGQGPGIMHCCTGNGARAIYYVWENILNYTDGKLKVNLLLNRASTWADVDSYIPYEGRVDVKIKVACDLSIRIPEWVTPSETRAKVSDEGHSLIFDGRYANVGKVKPGDVVTLTFPIFERTDVVNIQRQPYTLVRKGNDVVYIEPPGKNCPLYQRVHYRENYTRYRKIARFVSEQLVDW